MAETQDQAAIRAERRRAMMEGDFNPPYTPTNMPTDDARLANAAEYAAYQLGQINRNIARLVDLLERRNG